MIKLVNKLYIYLYQILNKTVMKKMTLSLFASLLVLLSIGQTNDKLLKHSGESLTVKVIKVGENTINFKYPGEEAEQTLSKFAVATITYGGSGRKETITEKIIISSKEDWEKVEVLTDASQVIGLKKEKKLKVKLLVF